MSAGRSAIPRATPMPDKRRLILDAAVRVFARQGFHACRVSDIADEAGVAYGLVYHYFASKDEVLDTLFLERWNVMLDAIRAADREEIPAREKLAAIAASFSRTGMGSRSTSRMTSSITFQRSRKSVSSTSSLEPK